ncbi:MAG: ferritin-like protein [Gemmatimonadales bacterium]
MPITTIASLRRHLQAALELEHSTIPPYLCALYSLPDGANPMAAVLIRSVVMEEMLHMVLAANVLNAVGGEPSVNHRRFVPSYPTYLPFSDKAFKVSLRPFSKEAIDTFLRIESPDRPNVRPRANGYATIGQFYLAILAGIELLEGRARARGKTIFTGPRRRQIEGSRWYYGGGGKPIEVHDLASARAAIHEIMEQGEGLDHTIFDGDERFGQVDELAHYFRFFEIRHGRRFLPTDTVHLATGAELPVDWSAAYPMETDPRARRYVRRPDIHRLMVAFNRRYTQLLDVLHRAFTGKPDQLQAAVPIMYELKYQARALMAIPTGRKDGSTVGPSFEFTPARASRRGSRRGARTRRSASR